MGALAGPLAAFLALAGCRGVHPGSERAPDWLLDPAPFVARLEHDGSELALTNGLVRRAWRTAPELACVALDDLTTGAALLRALEPEAALVLDGRRFDVGGLCGQPDRAYLRPGWLDALARDPEAFHLVGSEHGPIERDDAMAKRAKPQ